MKTAWLRATLGSLFFCFVTTAPAAWAAEPAGKEPFKPYEGQPGKDVVWVPTPAILVEKMLDMAKVTPNDFVMDLGSGDGRNIIAAARRGARALGVEWNADMVELSRQSAAKQGVADKAQFVQGDMFAADVSDATVLALFLLPDNLRKLTQKFLNMKPGTRIVANYFSIDGWTADTVEKIEQDCVTWCTSLLYIVPAKAAGTWRMPLGEIRLEQSFQVVSGSITLGETRTAITDGKLNGEQITFNANGVTYSGRVNGNTMSGSTSAGASWSATRVQ